MRKRTHTFSILNIFARNSFSPSLNLSATMASGGEGWEGALLEPFDDGHVPETFRNKKIERENSYEEAGGRPDPEETGKASVGATALTSDTGSIVRYPSHRSISSPPRVYVYDDALPPGLADEIYDVTVREGRPWGTYVTVQEMRDCPNPLNGRETGKGFKIKTANIGGGRNRIRGMKIGGIASPSGQRHHS